MGVGISPRVAAFQGLVVVEAYQYQPPSTKATQKRVDKEMRRIFFFFFISDFVCFRGRIKDFEKLFCRVLARLTTSLVDIHPIIAFWWEHSCIISQTKEKVNGHLTFFSSIARKNVKFENRNQVEFS